MCYAEFFEELLGERLCSRREKSGVEKAVRCIIDRSVEPVALIIELDHVSSTAM